MPVLIKVSRTHKCLSALFVLFTGFVHETVVLSNDYSTSNYFGSQYTRL